MEENKLTLSQYRTIDLVLFVLLTCVLELINMLAINVWFTWQLYTVSLFLPLCLIVMMRWGGYAAINAVLAAIIYCLTNSGQLMHYAIYIGGNLFILFLLLPLKLIGKRKLASKWYYAVLLTVGAYVLVEVGRAVIAALFQGEGFFAILLDFAAKDSLSAFLCAVVLLIARRQNGLFEDQVLYLLRIQEEQKRKSIPAEAITEQGLTQLGELHQKEQKVDQDKSQNT